MSKDEEFEVSAGEEGLVTCVCGSTTFKDESPAIITITGQVDGPTASSKKPPFKPLRSEQPMVIL